MAIENEYLLDWLSFTARKMSEPDEVIKKLGLEDLDFQDMKSGRYGYPAGRTVDGLINVLYSPYRADMGVHVEMTGQGVRRFEVLMKIKGLSWFKVLKDLNTFVRFSRIDVALDDFTGLLGFEKIIEKIDSGHHVGKFRSFKVISGRDSAGNHQGTTIYMGSSKSDSMLRVYEKNHERQLKGYEVSSDVWNRWELVLKHDKAVKFVDVFLSEEINGNLGLVFKGVLSDLIRFVEPSVDSNKARWETSSWWSDFLGDCEGISLSKGQYQPSLAKTIDWIDSSAFSSLKALHEVAEKEDLDFSDILFKREFRRRKFERANQLVREFEGLSKEDKKKIIRSLKNIGKEKRRR